MSQYTTGIICQKCGKATGRSIKDHVILCYYCYNKVTDIKPAEDSKQYRQWILQEHYSRPMFYGNSPDWEMIEALKPKYNAAPNAVKKNIKSTPETVIIPSTEFHKKQDLVSTTINNEYKVNTNTSSLKYCDAEDDLINNNTMVKAPIGENDYPPSCYDGW